MAGDTPPRAKPLDYARPARPAFRTSRFVVWAFIASLASCPYLTAPLLLMMRYDEDAVPVIALSLPVASLVLSIAAYVRMIDAPTAVTGAGMATISIWISAIWVSSCGTLLWFGW